MARISQVETPSGPQTRPGASRAGASAPTTSSGRGRPVQFLQPLQPAPAELGYEFYEMDQNYFLSTP